ncbi:MAG: hypothetical protein DMF84_00775 [Acidobacteria bacterium]|nr:MAG: hypothetical protein DMF84_00775 [Acidobacteriota bacterium]
MLVSQQFLLPAQVASADGGHVLFSVTRLPPGDGHRRTIRLAIQLTPRDDGAILDAVRRSATVTALNARLERLSNRAPLNLLTSRTDRFVASMDIVRASHFAA